MRNRNPNAGALAMRDPALAALMGVLPGADFGVDDEYSGGGHPYGGSDDDFGFEFGLEPAFVAGGGGGGFQGMRSLSAAPSATSMAQMASLHAQAAAQGVPGAAQTAALWSSAASGAAATKRRRSLIEPNADSDVKIERYTFAVTATIAHLGTTQAIQGTGNPQVNLRPQRVSTNAPIAGFVTLNTLQVANIGVIVGGIVDAWQLNANAVGSHLDMPTLSPANAASFSGNYTGVTPLEYGSSTAAFLFTIGLTGPASMSA